MREFEVTPLRLAGRSADSSLFLYLTDMGTKISIDYRLWILRGGDRTVLVDTGPPLPEARRRGITDIRGVDEALRGAGVEAAEIDTVVLTHLHWDHASNISAFPAATFVAQKAEVEFFENPIRELSCFDRFYSDQAELSALLKSGRVQSLQGDAVLEDGIELLHVGGHTPGSQMIRVRTPRGWAILTGDAIPLNRNFSEGIPSGITSNLIEAVEALERVRKLRPVAIYTGHDPVEALQIK
jgi:glyoxylase-like metal-dependent hydrolase (beta-lactamase superfamily II)